MLYLYPNRMRDELAQVESGAAPTERFYGLIELRKRGWEVDFIDARFEGVTGKAVRRLRQYGVNLVDPATVAAIRRHDIVVVKDGFSTMALLAAKTARRPLVYLDSMFAVPERRWKRTVARLNLQGADRVVAYSTRQIAVWAESFGMSRERFQYLPYTIDLSFYESLPPASTGDPPYVLSVGRDLGRDFGTLATALEGTGLHLKLVTLPYLAREVRGGRPWIEVLERVSYEELFRLYSRASLVVVPLKKGITYLSGVRGMLEGMALGRPLVVTRTPGLEEYAREGEVIFVEPEDPLTLRRAILALRDDPATTARLTSAAGTAVRERYGMDAFVDGFERILRSL